jgi:hypothetical protein
MVLGMLCAVQAQIIIDDTYPRLDVTPAAPVVGSDVSIRVVNGMHTDGCVPTYSDTSVRIEISPILIYPPRYNVTVSYTENWPGPGICLPVMTEYGPTFALGSLALGSYYVYDGDSLVGTFEVAQPCTVGGTVVNDVGNTRMMVMPQDSVTVRIFPDYSIYLDAQAPIPFPGSGYSDSMLTDMQGEFAFPRVPQGMYRVSFEKKGFITQVLSLSVTQDTALLVKLIPEGVLATIHGTVASACSNGPDTLCLRPAPMPGCTVWAMLACDNWFTPYGMDAPILCERLLAVTDAQGSYSFDSLPITRSGEWANVSVYVQGFTGQSVDTSISYGFPTTVDFVMYRSDLPVVSGRGTGSRSDAVVAGAGRVTVYLSRAQTVRVELFGLDGRRVAGSVRELQLGAGSHTVETGADGWGARVVRVTVEGTQHTFVAGARR